MWLEGMRLAAAHRHGRMQEAIRRVIRLAVADEHNTPTVGARRETHEQCHRQSFSVTFEEEAPGRLWNIGLLN